MIQLWPRLPEYASMQIWDSIHSQSVVELGKAWSTDHESAFFTATGGTRISAESLEDLRERLEETARKSGFPETSDVAGRRRFDQSSMAILHDAFSIPVAEAAKVGMWSFLALVLMPDIARWRFPDTDSLDRFKGNPANRNVFQRLWWRAELFRTEGTDDPYLMAATMREDAAVQIIERPGIASDRRLAFALASILLAVERDMPAAANGETLWRDVVKYFRQRMPVVDFGSWHYDELRSHIEEIALRFVDEMIRADAETGDAKKDSWRKMDFYWSGD